MCLGFIRFSGLRAASYHMSYSQYCPENFWTWVPTRECSRDYTKQQKGPVCASKNSPEVRLVLTVAHRTQVSNSSSPALAIRFSVDEVLQNA